MTTSNEIGITHPDRAQCDEAHDIKIFTQRLLIKNHFEYNSSNLLSNLEIYNMHFITIFSFDFLRNRLLRH